jgi:ABC-type transport system substrate-binding protein
MSLRPRWWMEIGDRLRLVTEVSPLDTLSLAKSPFATVVKHRATLSSFFGQFNMRKAASPWRDVRLRQAVNLAINRDDLVKYAAKGNGWVVPFLLPVRSVGYDPELGPYPFDPKRARQLLREAGYPNGLAIRLLAEDRWKIQATVVSKMLEQAGFTVDPEIVDATTFPRRVYLAHLDQPADKQGWDIALTSWQDPINLPLFEYYNTFVLDGASDWVEEQPEARRLYAEVMGTPDPDKQRTLMWQLERHTRDQAYFLFLYNPIILYATNRSVLFDPVATTLLLLKGAAVTDSHWSVCARKR